MTRLYKPPREYESVKVLSCDEQHENGFFSHSVLAYEAKTVCSLDQVAGEPPVIHGYFKQPLPEGTVCKLDIGDSFPELFLK